MAADGEQGVIVEGQGMPASDNGTLGLPLTVVVMGKGGVGKTTIAYHLLRAAVARGWTALGVDADPQASLSYISMVPAGTSLYQHIEGAVRNRRMGRPAVPREGYPQFLAGSLTQSPVGFDLLTMGQPLGEGCYCAANAAVKELVFGSATAPGLASRYQLTVMDCEAGSEKIARRMLGRGATILLVANPPDPLGRSEAMRGADRIAATLATEAADVRVVRVLNTIHTAAPVILTGEWYQALYLGAGEDKVALLMPQLLDQLSGVAR